MSGGPLLGYNKPFDLASLRYPLLASYKYDGWRAEWNGLEFMSRTLKTIPNRALQSLGAKYLGRMRSGWDGEIIVGEPTDPACFNRTDSFCKRQLGTTMEPIRFFVFDHAGSIDPFFLRLGALEDIPPFAVKVEQFACESPAKVLELYEFAVAAGYEGLVLRDPKGHYKNGRSGLREQLMLKLKPLEHCECPIIGFEELMHNANPAERDARGYLKRSSNREGLVPAGTLGALIVDWEGKNLRVGTFKGIDKPTLQRWWHDRDNLLGKLARIDFFKTGMKDLPKSARCSGLRSDLT